jgi:hypothetical protein
MSGCLVERFAFQHVLFWNQFDQSAHGDYNSMPMSSHYITLSSKFDSMTSYQGEEMTNRRQGDDIMADLNKPITNGA